MLTFGEAMAATAMLSVAGIALGVLLHRVRIVRLATETWIAALASAPLVLMYPLFLVIFGRSAWTIIMIAFVVGAAAGDPEDAGGPVRHAAGADQRRAGASSSRPRSSTGKSCFPRRCRRSSSACGSA